jgi:hypothetical protein
MGNLSQLFGLALLNNGDASPVREFFFRLELPAKAESSRFFWKFHVRPAVAWCCTTAGARMLKRDQASAGTMRLSLKPASPTDPRTT